MEIEATVTFSQLSVGEMIQPGDVIDIGAGNFVPTIRLGDRVPEPGHTYWRPISIKQDKALNSF